MRYQMQSLAELKSQLENYVVTHDPSSFKYLVHKPGKEFSYTDAEVKDSTKEKATTHAKSLSETDRGILSFELWLVESEGDNTSKHNSAYGAAFEAATVMHTHFSTAAATNADPEYLKKINAVHAKGKAALAKLPHHLAKRALQNGKSASEAYLKSLQANEGIKPEDVFEVHHTPNGINHLTGRDDDQSSTPHDMVVRTTKKTKRGSNLHGTSLKSTQGTASNNGPGVVPGLSTHFKQHLEAQPKLANMGNKDRKAYVKAEKIKNGGKGSDEFHKIKAAAKQACETAAEHHTSYFNNLSHEEKVKHAHKLMRYNSDTPIGCDYTNGEKGTSVPYEQHPAVKAVSESSHITMERHGTSTKMYGHKDGKKIHLLTIEHRYTHGAFTAPQVNAKFGSLK